ncbi:hypothetical protein MKK69_24605 [Methylobacterium sp. J-026]|uniref:hypothetical protein n=1 Tax=Methylobacterium sp. J-026 TaxID=2836624 RepID=UPI001FBA5A3F|nr:hypothetical protein [Methylobacterium sp. J-026]MCJ2137185.1 hypothetical protein [Methylobacterium sp. J-026]
MASSIGSVTPRGADTLSFKPLGQSQSAKSVQAAQQATRTQAGVATAQQALADANSVVDQDKRNHSPSCVACDQKLVDKAQAQLAHAKASASDDNVQTPPAPGTTVDITA